MAARAGRADSGPPFIWLWLSGRDLNGRWHTNATWLHDATKVLHVTGNATRWQRMRHWKRSAIRQAFTILVPVTAWDWWHHPVLTPAALSLLAVIPAGHWTWRGTRRFLPVRHYWQWVRPFRHTLQAELGLVPTAIQIDPARTRVLVGLPHEFLGSDNERAAITRAVEAKLAIEAPDATWRLQGRSHEVAFIHSPPPPPHLTWDEIEDAILAAEYHELVCGTGKGGAVVKASIESDSPMLGIGMGSGGGKTNLLAFWMAQRLRLGDMGYIIDGKRFSHPWAFKDMQARRDQLPNIGYVRRVDDIHRGLIRLGRELADRNEHAEEVINSKGRMLGDSRWRRKLWVGLEELNFIVPLLKFYWTLERERLLALAKAGQCQKPPKQSPALLALSQLSFAGRQVGIHLIFVGQRLDADVLGTTGGQGGAVRGNIGVRALARYDELAWNLQAGKTPMPPSPSVPGRIQLWVGGEVSETQVPEMDYEQVRKIAVSGDITPVPRDWPGVERKDGRDRAALPPAYDLGEVNGHSPGQGDAVLGPGTRPPGMMTIREALATGMFNGTEIEAVRQRVKRAKRKGRIRGGTFDGTSELFSDEEMRELVR